jgi:hypothetical protein
MKQILHIFSNDLRRLRIEILLSVVAAALFAWVVPKNWVGGPASVGNPYQTIADLVNPLVLLSWGLLIARLIHGEVLVGDKQFWITRPYEWPKLLAAKAFFVALLVYLPFLLMQVAILLQAGFNPLSYIPGLLYRLLLISLVFFPLIGLAAVTSNLVRMMLPMLGVYVALVALSSLAFFSHLAGLSYGNNEPMTYKYVQYGEPAAIAATLLLCGAVIVLLYARRRVLVARLLLGSTPFLVLLAYSIGIRSVSMGRAYPPAAQTEPSVIRMIPFEQDEASRVAAGRWGASEQNNFHNLDAKKWATIKVKLRASGVAAGDRGQLNAFRPTLTPAHGAPLELDWQQGQEVFEATEAPNQLHYFVLDFIIPRSDYDRLKSSTLTLHLDFALTQAKPARSWRLLLPEGNFTIPDLLSCSSQEDGQRDTLQITGLVCHYPLRTPVMMSLTTFPTKGPCPAAPAPAGDSVEGTSLTTVGDFNTTPATFGISPIEGWISFSFGTYNSNSGTQPVDSELSRVCPGTPVVVTQYRKVRAEQTGVTIENFRLGD